MTAYVVTGTLLPDATTLNTGEPVGTYNDQPYWSWTNDAGTWYLFYLHPSFGSDLWVIGNSAPSPFYAPKWEGPTGIDPVGAYSSNPPASGTANVAVYTPASPVFFVLQITSGPIAGKYIGYKVS